MRVTWSQDPKKILETLTVFIDTGLPVTIRLKSNWAVRSRIVRVHYHRDWPYLLLARPEGLESSAHIKELYLKMAGTPILYFACSVERETENMFAVRVPDTLHQLELRMNGRIVPLSGSMATFFIKNRARVSICTLENVSMGGIKLVGRPTHHIREKDIIGPCTISLAGADSLISREVTVDSSHVVRIADEDGHSGQFGLGLRFELNDNERGQLKEHIDFLGRM